MGKKYDFTGMRFGKLVVLGRSKQVKPRNVLWDCICDCGNQITITSGSLKSGNTKSCGCLRKEIMSNKPHDHHLSKTRLYVIWRNMKYRCYNSKNEKFKDYGARGIKVCDEWLGTDGFIRFRTWAYANGYNEDAEFFECTIDRIDVNGDYCPENCRWVTNAVQSRNKRNTRYFTINGETKALSEWCEQYNVGYSMVFRRVEKGMDVLEALTKPSRRKRT